jgi:hypothetical protein
VNAPLGVDRRTMLRRVRRTLTLRTVTAVILEVLLLPTAVTGLVAWLSPGGSGDGGVPHEVYGGVAVAVTGGALAVLAFVVAALYGRSALTPAIAGGGPVDTNRAAAGWRACVVGTYTAFIGYGAGIAIGVINSVASSDFLPTWGVLTSGGLVFLVVLIVRRGLAITLRWLPRA